MELHPATVFHIFRNLNANRPKLYDVPVLFERPGLVFGGMAHFQGNIQFCHELFDLALVYDSSMHMTFSGQSLEETDPFTPFPISWFHDKPLI